MEIKEMLRQVAEENLKDDSYFIVDIIVKGSTGGKMKVLILLDADEGVNIDDCADLSRAVGHKVETEELIEQAYTLEVSSPGLDHPLLMTRQFVKNIGRGLKIHLTDGSIITGKLEGATDTSIELNKEVKEKKKTVYQLVTIGFQEIDKANVLVSFK
jgi:ribosome maturation factor RimP